MSLIWLYSEPSSVSFSPLSVERYRASLEDCRSASDGLYGGRAAKQPTCAFCASWVKIRTPDFEPIVVVVAGKVGERMRVFFPRGRAELAFKLFEVFTHNLGLIDPV